MMAKPLASMIKTIAVEAELLLSDIRGDLTTMAVVVPAMAPCVKLELRQVKQAYQRQPLLAGLTAQAR